MSDSKGIFNSYTKEEIDRLFESAIDKLLYDGYPPPREPKYLLEDELWQTLKETPYEETTKEKI